MKDDVARNIHLWALNAIRELNAIATLELDWAEDVAPQSIRKSLGALIWQIDRDMLVILHADFPELNDLGDMDFTQGDRPFGG